MKTNYWLQRRDDGTLGLRAGDRSSATGWNADGSAFGTRSNAERGSALIPALMIVSMVAMLGLSMLSAGASGSRVTTGQADDYKLTSAVESVGTLAAENLWSGYL